MDDSGIYLDLDSLLSRRHKVGVSLLALALSISTVAKNPFSKERWVQFRDEYSAIKQFDKQLVCLGYSIKYNVRVKGYF